MAYTALTLGAAPLRLIIVKATYCHAMCTIVSR